MRWSKLKQKAEARFCEALRGRLELHSTRYRGTHDDEGRVWITFDRKEIFSACSLTAWAEEYRHARALQAEAGCTDFRDPTQRTGYQEAYREAQIGAEARGIHSQYAFYNALEEWLNLSIEDAIASPHALIRALARVDLRLGRRRLAQLQTGGDAHPLVRRFHELRLECASETRPQSLHGK